MQAVTTIGLDIAKSVFQVHGIDAQGNVIVRRQLKRRYVLAFFQRHLIAVSPLCQRPRQAPACASLRRQSHP
jgi:transposase